MPSTILWRQYDIRISISYLDKGIMEKEFSERVRNIIKQLIYNRKVEDYKSFKMSAENK